MNWGIKSSSLIYTLLESQKEKREQKKLFTEIMTKISSIGSETSIFRLKNLNRLMKNRHQENHTEYM